MTKTLNELITIKGEAAVFGDIVDQATQDELVDIFYDRYCNNDDDKFIRQFQRNLRLYNKQYVNMLRIENTQFDPMITRYLEREVVNRAAKTGVLNASENGIDAKHTANGGNQKRKTDIIGTSNGNVQNNETNNYNSQKNGSHQDNNSEQDNATDRQRDILSVFPQANVSSQTSGSLDDAISYRYATQMTDKQNKHNGNKNAQSNGSTSDRETGGNVLNGTSVRTNKDITDGTETIMNDFIEDVNKNRQLNKSAQEQVVNDGKERERFTGRENYDAGTLLTHAREYVASTNALLWLVDKMELCFIGNLRYGEE